MDHIEAQFGDDLVFAELHLDEDTPHIHFVVAPTYQKTARKPGRQKRNETIEEFEARKCAVAEKPTVRKVGRASHTELSKINSFQVLRQKMALAVDHLGIEYGEDRSLQSPVGKTTREWVKETAWKLRREQAQLKREKLELAEARKRAEMDGFAAGKVIAFEAHRDAMDAADALLSGTIPSQDLTRDAVLTRTLVERIQSERSRSARVNRPQDQSQNWFRAMESYLLRVGDNLWQETLIEVRNAHRRGVENVQASFDHPALLDRTKAIVRAIVGYWNEVGEAIGCLFRRIRPSDDDQMIGTVDRLLPELLDEKAYIKELAAEAEHEHRKTVLGSGLLHSSEV